MTATTAEKATAITVTVAKTATTATAIIARAEKGTGTGTATAAIAIEEKATATAKNETTIATVAQEEIVVAATAVITAIEIPGGDSPTISRNVETVLYIRGGKY